MKSSSISSIMSLKYLITGVTGGLGAEVLNYFIKHIPTSQFAAASSQESNRKQFEDQGIAFRVVNYDDKESLERSLRGVENLLFVSTNVFDNERRAKQHRNVVEAAKTAGVGHVSYMKQKLLGKNANLFIFLHDINIMDRCGIRLSLLEASNPTPKPLFSRPIW